MKRPDPPDSLPPEYLPIWQALRQADERASSRQALAGRLGVATLTLQRILVTGDVPSFRETTSTRILHAWVRTLSRLAIHFGHDPREWVEKVGIRWNARIEGVSASALKKRPAPVESADARPDLTLPTGKFLVGGGDHPQFCRPLVRLRDSFLDVYARRLLSAVDRSSRVVFRTAPEWELLEGLTADPPSLRLGIGLLETTERRRRGLDFLPIPGLYVKLDAVRVRRIEDRVRPLAWRDAVSADGTACDFLVLKEGVAAGFLVGQCDIPRERLLVRAAAGPPELADVLAGEAGRRSRRQVILVAEEETCRQTIERIVQLRRFMDRFAVEPIEGAAEEMPAYPLCLAWKAKDAAFGELLSAAQTREMFAHASHQTARLYAELVAAAMPGLRLRNFDGATSEFRTAFCRHLITILVEIGSDELQIAERLVPEPWRPTLHTVLHDSRPPRPAGAPAQEKGPVVLVHCRSCSALLSDGIHGGVSDRYCRFCADEEGRLKPRHEVEDLITKWFRHWQGDLTDKQARRRAVLFMQSMPAWNEN